MIRKISVFHLLSRFTAVKNAIYCRSMLSNVSFLGICYQANVI